jgi:hypothetical protein
MKSLPQEDEDEVDEEEFPTPSAPTSAAPELNRKLMVHHAVITPIEEASVETSLSQGMMSDSSILDPTMASPSSATPASASAAPPSRPSGILKKRSSESQTMPLEITGGAEPEVRFADPSPKAATTTASLKKTIATTSTTTPGGTKRVSGGKSKRGRGVTTERVSKAIQNIQEILLAQGNETASSAVAGPGGQVGRMSTRAQMTKTLQRTNEERRRGGFGALHGGCGGSDAQPIKGEQSLILLDSEVLGIPLSQPVTVGTGREEEHFPLQEDEAQGQETRGEKVSLLSRFRSLQTKSLLADSGERFGDPELQRKGREEEEDPIPLVIKATPLGGGGSSHSINGEVPFSWRPSRGIIQAPESSFGITSSPSLSAPPVPSPFMKLDDLYSKFYAASSSSAPSSATHLGTGAGGGGAGGSTKNLFEEAFQIQHLAQNIQSRQSHQGTNLESLLAKNRNGGGGGGGGSGLSKSMTSLPKESIPSYMRSQRGGSGPGSGGGTGSGSGVREENGITEDDETILKAYAAVLGLDWYHEQPTTAPGGGAVAAEEEEGGEESMQELVFQLQNIRQSTPISPKRELLQIDITPEAGAGEGLLENSTRTLPSSGRLSAPQPPKPLQKQPSFPLPTAAAPPAGAAGAGGTETAGGVILREDSGSTISSCDDSTTIFSLPSQQQQHGGAGAGHWSPYSSRYFDDQERELEDDLRQYLRGYDTPQGAQGAQGQGPKRTTKNPMKRLITSHSTSAVVKAARQDQLKLSQNLTSSVPSLPTQQQLLLKKKSKLSSLPRTTGTSPAGGGDRLPALGLSSSRIELNNFTSPAAAVVMSSSSAGNLKKRLAGGGTAATAASQDAQGSAAGRVGLNSTIG